jgi:hypothetical protein
MFATNYEPARSVLRRLGLNHSHVRCDENFCFIGSAQEFAEAGILGCFPEGDEFGLGHGHAPSFQQQQQVMPVLIATAASEQALDVAVYCFHNAHRDFRSAVVENPSR